MFFVGGVILNADRADQADKTDQILKKSALSARSAKSAFKNGKPKRAYCPLSTTSFRFA